MWIKICGITSIEDAKLAIAAGADAVGFVFAESPRRVTPEQVREISRDLPPSIEKIGVFVDATLGEILSATQTAALNGVQLHGQTCAGLIPQLRQHADKTLPPLRILQVLHYDVDARFEYALRELHANSPVNTVLVDTRVAGKEGGTGIPFDWSAARDTFRGHAPHLRLIAAGGLNPGNVGRAIQALQPWGVDVSSGVEMAPGKKDAGRIVEFVRAARAAAVEFDSEMASMHRGK